MTETIHLLGGHVLDCCFPSKHNGLFVAFEKKNVHCQPEHRPYDCPIDLKDDVCPCKG